MKTKLLLSSLAALSLLASCGKESEVVKPEGETTGYIAFSVAMSGTETKALGGFEDLDAASKEGTINNAVFFFFDAAGAQVTAPVVATDLTDATPQHAAAEDAAKVMYAKLGSYKVTPAKVVAIVNYDDVFTAAQLSAGMSLSELKAVAGNYVRGTAEIATKGVVMSNSIYYDASETLIDAVDIPADAIQPTMSEALNKKLTIHVDRATAKVTFATLGTTQIAVNPSGLTDDQKKTMTVDGTPTTLEFVPVKSWVSNAIDKMTLLKDVPTYVASAWWLDDSNYRTYWANKYATGVTYAHPDFNSSPALGDDIFVNENVNIANPDAASNIYETSPLAVVGGYFKVNGGSNQTIVKYLGQYFTLDGFKEFFLNMPEVKDKYFTGSISGTALTKDDIEIQEFDNLTNGVQLDNPNYDGSSTDYGKRAKIENYEGILVIKAKSGTAIYDSATEVTGSKFAGDFTVSDYASKGNYYFKVQLWRDGYAYFYLPIVHNDALTGDPHPEGYYGLVRNHHYKINVSKLSGMGTPLVCVSKEIIPETPIDSEAYIAAQIEVLKYKIVNHDYEFGK